MYSNHYLWNRYFPQNTVRKNVNNKIKVTGEGRIQVQPNQAIVRMGVITENRNLQEAQTLNAQNMHSAIQSLIEVGIPRKNISTTEYRIDLNYDYKDGEQIFRGYRVTNLVEVKIEDINKVGQIIDIAVENGVNTVSGINMSLSNKVEAYDQALTNAVQNAQHKAQVIGQSINVSVSNTPRKVIEITERPDSWPQPRVLGISTDSATVPTPIEPGLMEIKAIVEVEFTY